MKGREESKKEQIRKRKRKRKRKTLFHLTIQFD
jgi:hypothetical protein